MTMDPVRRVVIAVAKEKILPRFNNLREQDITAKSPGDMVSIADIEAECALTAELKRLFPAAMIAGEESIAERPDLLAAVMAADQAFLIDPVDGTNNFIKGDDRYALMVTELRKAETVAGWIYLPAYDRIIMAEKGSGTLLDGKKIRISDRKFNPGRMIAAAHINRFPKNMRTIARKNLKKFRENRPAFCAGYDYMALSIQEKDFSLYYRTLPWDHLPGSLIYVEAGGYARTLSDEQYSIHHLDKGLLSAPDPDQWQRIREIIFPGLF